MPGSKANKAAQRALPLGLGSL